MPPANPGFRPDSRGDRASPRKGDGPSQTLWFGLAALALARAALGYAPGMWTWGLNLHRFLSPALAWLPWCAAALALAPPVARRLAPPAARIGDAIGRGSIPATFAVAVAAALLVLSLPDRVRFVGDFLIRQGTVEEAVRPGQVWPQALPLDVLLHYTLPLAASDLGLTDANGAARALGAIGAACLALAACAFARALSLAGGAALAAAAVAFFGGALGLFTGYSKAFAEMAVLAAATGALGIMAIRQGRGLLALGLTFAIGVALHRSALGFLPALALAWALWLRTHGSGGRWRARGTLVALAVPVLALAVMGPRIVSVALRFDPTHFASAEVMARGGVWKAAFAGPRPFDLANLVLMLSPLAVLAPALALAGGLPRRRPETARGREAGVEARPAGAGGGRSSASPPRPGPREALYLAVLALPFVAVAPFLHPVGGLFRDWDDFAAMGVALSLLTALLVGETLRRASRPWLGVAVALAAAMPAGQWLAHHTDLDRGIARAHAAATEPPSRAGSERASIWDYLGTRNYQLERWRASADAFRNATETAPSPRMLMQLAMAETMAGDLEAAREAYRRQLEKEPASYAGWMGLAAVASRIPDYAECRRALNRLLEIRPGDPEATGLLRALDEQEARLPAPP